MALCMCGRAHAGLWLGRPCVMTKDAVMLLLPSTLDPRPEWPTRLVLLAVKIPGVVRSISGRKHDRSALTPALCRPTTSPPALTSRNTSSAPRARRLASLRTDNDDLLLHQYRLSRAQACARAV